MNNHTVTNLQGLNGNALWKDEGMVNGIWNGIINSAYTPMTLNAGSYVIAPELWKGTFKADLAVMIVKGDGTFNKPSLCFEGKGGSNTDTLMNAFDQVKDWTTSAKIGTYGSIWGLAVKAQNFMFVALDRKKDDQWIGVALPTAAGGAPTFVPVKWPAYDITNLASITGLGHMLNYIAAHPKPSIPRA